MVLLLKSRCGIGDRRDPLVAVAAEEGAAPEMPTASKLAAKDLPQRRQLINGIGTPTIFQIFEQLPLSRPFLVRTLRDGPLFRERWQRARAGNDEPTYLDYSRVAAASREEFEAAGRMY